MQCLKNDTGLLNLLLIFKRTGTTTLIGYHNIPQQTLLWVLTCTGDQQGQEHRGENQRVLRTEDHGRPSWSCLHGQAGMTEGRIWGMHYTRWVPACTPEHSNWSDFNHCDGCLPPPPLFSSSFSSSSFLQYPSFLPSECCSEKSVPSPRPLPSPGVPAHSNAATQWIREGNGMYTVRVVCSISLRNHSRTIVCKSGHTCSLHTYTYVLTNT